MKKTLVALAVLAATGTAFAQSSVTLSGLYTFSYQNDLTVNHNSATATTNPVQLGGGSSNPTGAAGPGMVRAGQGFAVTDANLLLSAVEDLGGGMRANFSYLLETAAFRGAAVTRADSTLGLSGGFGSVALRNTRLSDLLATVGSPAIFLPDGLYDSTGILSRSAIDTVGYTSPELVKGLRVSVTYVELNDGAISTPTTNGTTKAVSNTFVLSGTYSNGPLSVAAAYKGEPSDNMKVNGLAAQANMELAVSYDLGFARVAYGYDGASQEGASTTTSAGAFASTANAQAIANLQTKSAQGVSVTVPFGAITVGGQYFNRGDAKVTEFGATYAFSKRTLVTVATGTKDGNAEDAGFNGTQYRLGMRHSF